MTVNCNNFEQFRISALGSGVTDDISVILGNDMFNVKVKKGEEHALILMEKSGKYKRHCTGVTLNALITREFLKRLRDGEWPNARWA